MPADILVADEQDDVEVEIERWAALARRVLTHQRIGGDVEVSLLFVDEAAIAALNEEFLGRQGPTDVLAFPIEDEPPPSGRYPDSGETGPGGSAGDSPPTLLGDVVICPAVAARQARDHDVELVDELALLVVHGLLHLLGMDHEVPSEAEAMERLERELLARFHSRGDAPP